MKTFFYLLTGMLLFPASFLLAQNEKTDCKTIINGSFYSYPKNSSDAYVSERDGDYQREMDLKTGDTTLYKVNWMSNCTYSLKFISGSTKYTREVRDIIEKHKFVYKVVSITDSYYTFSGSVDRANNPSFTADTMWLNKKENVASKAIFSLVADESLLKKSKFSDTSAYAIVYLYRPKKIGMMLSGYLVFLDNNLMAGMSNGDGYIFKIFKEGTYQLEARLLKQKPVLLSLPVKFGNRYYIKSEPNFTLSTGSGWKPGFKIMEESKGRNDFESSR